MRRAREYSEKYSKEYNPLTKVFYRPIEAAVRWSGLARHEQQIVAALQGKRIPNPDDFPKWPALRLNAERIYDAIANGELPFGVDGVTVHDKPDQYLGHPNLTIRHVDLKSWITRYYPDQRPEFLFSWLERTTHPTITVDAVHILIFERDLFRDERDKLRGELEQYDREIQLLRGRLEKHETSAPTDARDHTLSARSETTYLHIIGSLLDLLLGHSPSGQAYSTFKTQESVIGALTAHHGERLGISKSTLEAKFAAAKRALTRH